MTDSSSVDFLRRLKIVSPIKILTDNGFQFTDRFAMKDKKPSGQQVLLNSLKLYNHQRVIGSKTPLQALKEWQQTNRSCLLNVFMTRRDLTASDSAAGTGSNTLLRCLSTSQDIATDDFRQRGHEKQSSQLQDVHTAPFEFMSVSTDQPRSLQKYTLHRQPRARFLQPSRLHQRMNLVRQLRYIGDSAYPLLHVQLHSLLAQPDLDRPVR